ncbi:MAG: DinB family protein [Acidobacteriota bacterium]|nr:DinB family protein [Acidobacteriota bacterium]
MRILALWFLTAACLLAESNPLTKAVTARYSSAKQFLTRSSEIMPEADYSFKLSVSQRPFSEWIQHTAMGNYGFCSAIGSGARPDTANIHDATKKEELVAALKQSFDYCDEALKSMDDAKALAETGGKYPVNAMIGLIASLNDHYGNIVGYLRAKGLTPPSSEPKKAAK